MAVITVYVVLLHFPKTHYTVFYNYLLLCLNK